MPLTVAYLAQGKVRLKQGDDPPRTIESPYARSTQEKAVRAQQRNAWKSEGTGFLSGATLWGSAAGNQGLEPARITSLCRGAEPGQIVYSMTSGSLCALLSSDRLGSEERRLWNNNKYRLHHLAIHSQTGECAFAVQHLDGTANIGVMLKDDSGVAEITEGDSVDATPSWVPGPGRKLVFQSAGIGRDRHGHWLALGPFRIEQVNVDTAELETLLEHDTTDFLAPKINAAGVLYFIERPYEGRPRVNPLRVFKDTLLLPFRLLYAVFQYFNFFSMRYTGKKLTPSTDHARGKPMDLQQMMIWGNLVQARRPSEGDEPPDLVPGSWRLIRRHDGAEKVIARGVLAYDLAQDGTVVYSNGSAVYAISPDGKKEKLVAEAMIEQVAIIAS